MRGSLLEETHYYPFGLTMVGISSKAAGKLENKKNKFQGQELDDDLGVNWYGFKWRNHDPQIGRFIEIDPLSDKYVHNSTYAFSENKVTVHVELEGLESTISPYIIGAYYGLKAWFTNRVEGSRDATARVSTAPAKRTSSPVVNAQNSIQRLNDIGQAITPYTDILVATNVAGSLIPAGEAGAIGLVVKGGRALEGGGLQLTRTNLASEFYTNAGFTGEKAAAHMEGIDFSKAVQTVTLKEGTVVQQWVGENGVVGNYFTTLENGTTQNLGISYEGRTLKQFTLTSDVKVLKSTASEYKGNSGGGVQLFSTELNKAIKPVN